MKRASPRSSVRYQLPSEAYASCSWLKRPMPVSRLDAPVSGSISQTHPERSSGSLMNGNSSFVRYVFHGVIAAAQRLCRPVVITSTSLTVVPSLSSVRRDTEPQPSESSSPGRCSGTWHLPTSPSKSPGRGCVSSWLFRSHISPPGAWKSTFPSGSSGSGKVTPLSVERAGVHITDVDEKADPPRSTLCEGLQAIYELQMGSKWKEDRPMNNGSKGAAKMTAGLDLGDKYSYLCLLDDESGEVIEESRLRTTPEAIRRRFDSEQPLRIAIEVGTHSPWVSRLLEECGHQVLVANARKLHLIYANKRKSDKLDAENLARLARVDPKLLYPLEHRSEQSQAHLALLHSREVLVRSRTQLINH